MSATITITTDLINTINNLDDRATLQGLVGTPVPQEMLVDMISVDTYNHLFAQNNHPLAELLIEREAPTQETAPAQSQEDTVTNNYVELSGYNFLPRTKGDRAYVGKTMPLDKASKALLLDLVEAMGTRIGELEHSTPVPEDQDLMLVLKREFYRACTVKQREWLKKPGNACLDFKFYKDQESKFHITMYGFGPRTCQAMVQVVQRMAANNPDWYCKTNWRQGQYKGQPARLVEHVYVNMH